MKEKITNWNVLDGLRTNTEIAAFLEAAIEEGDYKFFLSALSDAVHAQKINETARNMDVDRESLYKDISNEQNPDYEAIFKAIDWLGLKVSFSPKFKKVLANRKSTSRIRSMPTAKRTSKSGTDMNTGDIKIFDAKKVRTLWNEDEEEWYFSVVDVVAALTDQATHAGARNYWKVLKNRIKSEGSETVTKCHGLKFEENEPVTICNQLKMLADDGKMRLTDVANTQQLFRLIQSIPSPKAEPFKQWIAQVAKERLDQMQDPELSIEQAMLDYKRLGYSDSWINQRLKSIEIRKELTDEWKQRGLQEGVQFATLTDIITQTWSDKTTKEYKRYKSLKKENLRDNMTNAELVLNMLAELSTKQISESSNPESFGEHAQVAQKGGEVARNARLELEAKTGKKVISPLNAKKGIALK